MKSVVHSAQWNEVGLDNAAKYRVMGHLGYFNDRMTRAFDDLFGTYWAEIEEMLAVVTLLSDDVISTRRLAEVSGMNRRSVSRLVLRLREAGSVMSQRAPADGRVMEVVLTERGKLQSQELRDMASAVFIETAHTAAEISRELQMDVTSLSPLRTTDPLQMLERICRAGAELVQYLPEPVSVGKLAARQRAGLVFVATNAGVRQRDLAQALGLSRAGTSYVVGQLCMKGLIVKADAEVDGDRRVVPLVASPAGERVVQAVLDAIEEKRVSLAQLFSELSCWQYQP